MSQLTHKLSVTTFTSGCVHVKLLLIVKERPLECESFVSDAELSRMLSFRLLSQSGSSD